MFNSKMYISNALHRQLSFFFFFFFVCWRTYINLYVVKCWHGKDDKFRSKLPLKTFFFIIIQRSVYSKYTSKTPVIQLTNDMMPGPNYGFGGVPTGKPVTLSLIEVTVRCWSSNPNRTDANWKCLHIINLINDSVFI